MCGGVYAEVGQQLLCCSYYSMHLSTLMALLVQHYQTYASSCSTGAESQHPVRHTD